MQPEQQSQNQPPTGWQFNSGQTTNSGGQQFNTISDNNGIAQQNPQEQPDSTVSWTASEFIAYQKGVGWYVVALMALLVIGGIIFLITKDYISAIMTSLLIFVFIVFASRKPRVLNYEISDQGIHIGNNLINFSTLKSFAVIDEGSIRSIDLLPLKRFMPSISMYFEPQDELKIVQALGSYLPKEERNQPFIDKLMHKIRF